MRLEDEAVEAERASLDGDPRRSGHGHAGRLSAARRRRRPRDESKRTSPSSLRDVEAGRRPAQRTRQPRPHRQVDLSRGARQRPHVEPFRAQPHVGRRLPVDREQPFGVQPAREALEVERLDGQLPRVESSLRRTGERPEPAPRETRRRREPQRAGDLVAGDAHVGAHLDTSREVVRAGGDGADDRRVEDGGDTQRALDGRQPFERALHLDRRVVAAESQAFDHQRAVLDGQPALAPHGRAARRVPVRDRAPVERPRDLSPAVLRLHRRIEAGEDDVRRALLVPQLDAPVAEVDLREAVEDRPRPRREPARRLLPLRLPGVARRDHRSHDREPRAVAQAVAQVGLLHLHRNAVAREVDRAHVELPAEQVVVQGGEPEAAVDRAPAGVLDEGPDGFAPHGQVHEHQRGEEQRGDDDDDEEKAARDPAGPRAAAGLLARRPLDARVGAPGFRHARAVLPGRDAQGEANGAGPRDEMAQAHSMILAGGGGEGCGAAGRQVAGSERSGIHSRAAEGGCGVRRSGGRLQARSGAGFTPAQRRGGLGGAAQHPPELEAEPRPHVERCPFLALRDRERDGVRA